MAYLKERQSVIIYDKKSNVEKITAFIKKIEVPAVNIRIDVDFLGSGTTRNDRLNVKFGNTKTPRVNNQIIFRNGKMVKINRIDIKAQQQSGRTTRNTSQFILTQSGHPARLWVGKTIVDPSWLRYRKLFPVYTLIVPTGGGGAIVVPSEDNDIEWRDIGSSLYVLPTALPNGKIKLELYPVVSYLENDADDVKHHRKNVRKNVVVQDVKTSLILQNGQRVSIGGVIGQNNKFYRSLFGPEFLNRDDSNSILDMYVTATIVKPGSSGRRSYIPRTPDVKSWKK
jgi:type II secretory pathway component HofQ